MTRHGDPVARATTIRGARRELVALLLLGGLGGCAPDPSEPSAWFGIAPPPGLGDPHRPVVDVGDARPPEAEAPEGWAVADSEQVMRFGAAGVGPDGVGDDESPFLSELASRGVERYGFRLDPEFQVAVPGDLGGYASLGVPRVQAIHSGPMYHTSGDVLETISVPGLERAARFFAFYLRESAAAEREQIQPELDAAE